MTDLHEAFATWLLRGGREELPRDVALHASTCPECLGGAAAMDALGVVDPGAAELPPLRVVAGRYRRRRGIAPAVTGAAAVLLVVAAGIVAGGLLFNPPRSVGVAVATPTPAEGVLGDQGGPSASATATASPAPTDSLTETAGPSPTPAPTAASLPSAPPEPNPTMGGGPPPPPPSTGPTTTPTPRPTPTPPPTPAPTPTPTIPPTPTPSPVLDDCEDNIDNDGDLLIDAADPGCPLDGNEASA